MNRRPTLTPAQQGKLLAQITHLMIKAEVHHDRTRHFMHVAWRLRNWMAGVTYNAQWQTLYDAIERQYSWGRISLPEAVWQLRQIGVPAFSHDWKFPLHVEQQHKMAVGWHKQKVRFDPVQWELDHAKRAVGE